MESKNLYETKKGWWEPIETIMNEMGIGWKSVLLILFIVAFVTYLAGSISIFLGLFKTHLSFDFMGKMKDALFASLNDSSLNTDPLRDAVATFVSDMGRLFVYHSWIGVIAGYFVFDWSRKQSKEMGKSKFVKGTKLITEEERLKDIAQKVASGELVTNLEIGRIPMPYKSEVEHTMIVAATRAGKGVTATKIIPKIGADPKARAIIHDKKPEWVRICYRPERGDIIFNPMDARSVKFTIWNDIRDAIDIKAIAYAIVPNLPEAKDPFWQNSARDILESILVYLWERGDHSNKAIRDLVYMPGEELAIKLEGHKGAEYAKNRDCLSTLKSQMAWIDFLEEGDFSIREWIVNGTGILFLLNPRRTEALLKPVLTLFIDIACASILELPDDESRRIHLFLDEFTSLNRIDSLIDIAKLGASKGAPLWLMFQDIKQVNKIYSEHDADTLMNNCKNLAVGQIKDPKAAEYFSQRFSKQEFLESEKTNSMGIAENKDGKSTSERRKEEYVVKPHDLINLPKRQFFVMIEGYEGVTQTTADIQAMEQIAEDFVMRSMSKEYQIGLLKRSAEARKNADVDDAMGDEQIVKEIEKFKDFF